MPPVSTRQSNHSSNLIRVLSDLTLLQVAESGGAFVDELGQWLKLNDAITLHAVHAADATTLLSASGPTEKAALNEDYVRLRASLMTLDLPGEATQAFKTRINKPSSQSGESIHLTEPTFDPYRRSYVAHQRTMETSIRAFRTKVREVLIKTSPTLAKLAALDAVFDQSLGERERQLLSRLPALLEQRFEQLRRTDPEPIASNHDGAAPASSMTPTIWLTRFCQELQAVVIAELDMRLEPTLGLVEAYNSEIAKPS